MSLVYRVFRNILQFYPVYLTYNAYPLPHFKFAKVANLCYDSVHLLFGLILYLNKYPVVGWK
jgi:hypothetical protein